jgi:hypothetical protein
VHELVGADGVRHAIRDRPCRAVDHDLAAAAQPQPRPVLVDALDRLLRVPDGGAQRVLGRARINLDEQLGNPLETAEPDAVRAEPMFVCD